MRATVPTASAYLSRRLGEVTTLAFIALETGDPDSFMPNHVRLVGWTARRYRPLSLTLSANDAAALGRSLLRLAQAATTDTDQKQTS